MGKLKNNWNFFHLSLIVLLVLFVYFNSLNSQFVFDDKVIILGNSFIRNIKNLPKIFTHNYFTLAQEGFYRPVATVSYFIDYAFWKLNPFGWRLTNIFFHIANAILIYFIVSLIFSRSLTSSLPNSITALTTALVFALHPVHTEVINCISFRKDIISFFFFLLAFFFYIRSNQRTIQQSRKQTILLYIVSCLSFIVALFAKETAIILPLVLLVYEKCFVLTRRKNDFLRKHLSYWFVAVFFLLFNFFLFKPVGYILGIDISQPRVYPPGGAFIRLLNSCKAFVYYLKLLFLPTGLIVDYELPTNYFSFDLSVVLSVIFLLVILLFGLIVFKYSRLISFSIFYFFISLLPVSNIVPIGTFMAERYLYFPSLGFSLFFVFLLFWVSKMLGEKGKKIVFICFVLLLTFYSLRTIKRNTDWKDSFTLWSKTIEVSPRSWLARTNLGDAYSERSEYDRALSEYMQSLEIYPDAPETYASLGELYYKRKQYERAIFFLECALVRRPHYAEACHALGEVYGAMGKTEQAIAEFNKVVEINPFYVEAYSNLGNVYYKKGEYEKAFQQYEKALRFDPNFTEAKNNLQQALEKISSK